MPHATLQLIPGVDQNRTSALNETAISYSNLVRFIPDRQGFGLVQKLGGWTLYYPNSFATPVRSLLAWEGLNNDAYLAVGSEAELAVINNGNAKDITPQTFTHNVAVSLSTTTGSSVVNITDTGSNISNFDSVFIETPIAVDGYIISGLYQCTAVSSNTFSIVAHDTLGNPLPATSTVVNGGVVPQFTLTNGSPVIDVYFPGNTYAVGDTFAILVQTNLGGISLYGNYTILTVGPTSGHFSINAATKASTVATTGASGTGTTATLTFAGTYSIPVGSVITVSGVTPSGYNGTFTVTASTANSVSYANATTGAQTVVGTIFVNSYYINNNQARYLFYYGSGPATAGSGYGIGGYGRGGYGTGITLSPSAGTPITTTDWSLDNWGQILIACPTGGAIYEWIPTTGQLVANIAPNCPPINQGMFVAMPQRQIIAYGSTFNGVQDPLLIRWCDINDYTSWIGTVVNQAGSYRIPKGSRIVGAIQGPQQGLIWTDLAVWAMQYVGLPYVYQFNEIGTGCGLVSAKAAISMNGVVYWMSQSQFFKLSGAGVEPVICPIWDVIFQDLDTNHLDKIRVAPNSRFGEISWYYPTVGGGGEITNYVKYNVVLQQWDFGVLQRTAWINQSVLGAPIGAGQVPGGSGYYIVQHETSTDAVNSSGAPVAMDSYFQTGYFEMNDGDLLTFIDQVWPDAKWGYYGGTQTANLLMTFYYCDYAGDTPKVAGPFTLTEATQYVTPRLRGRLVSIKIESMDTGSFWRIGRMRYRYQQDGKF